MPVIVSTKRALRKATTNHTNNVAFKEVYKKIVKDLGKVMPDPIVKDEDDF